MAIFLPEKGIYYPNNEHEILSQICSDDLDAHKHPLSYIEVYLKSCQCDERCKRDKFRMIWHNDAETSKWDMDERDIIDTISVFSQALSVIKNREALNL